MNRFMSVVLLAVVSVAVVEFKAKEKPMDHHQLAVMSAEAYLNEPANLPWLTHEYRLRVESTDTQALCGRVGEDVVVAFRGSSSVHDWMLNANARMNSQGMHAGFHEAAESAFPDVMRHIRNVGQDVSKIYLTGHSLGGALAVITGHMLSDSGVMVEQVVTFGCPRVGSERFVQTLPRERIRQYVTLADKVPHLPAVLLGFRHASQIQQIVGGGSINLDAQASPEIFAPHSMRTYLAGV